LTERIFQFYDTSELMSLPPQSWLIYKVLPDCGLALLFGPPGEGKSFVALDWALCVATGQPWLGKHRVQQGHVLYIAAEGGGGMKKRVAAWEQLHYGAQGFENITWYLDSLNVLEEGVVETFMAQLEDRFDVEVRVDRDTGELQEESQMDLRLVVVDTLSRNFGGEDENMSGPMTTFVEKLDLFAKKHGALVLIVHHTNAAGARERGHSALKAATEAAFHCTAEKAENGALELIQLKNFRQKDEVGNAPLYLAPLVLELPRLDKDEEGEVLTSVVLEATEAPEPKHKSKAGDLLTDAGPMTGKQMLKVLAVAEHGFTFNEWRLACGLNKSAFVRRINTLKAQERIHKDEATGRYLVVEGGEL
jgi:hypothetical protein